MAEEGERREGEGEEMALLVFIRDNFLIFSLCAFWRLKLDPLQMRRGTDRRKVAARHASRSWGKGGEEGGGGRKEPIPTDDQRKSNRDLAGQVHTC